jgi:hypothetical protein
MERPLAEIWKILTYPVIIAMANSSLFAILSETQDTILPLFLASPVDVGGLNLNPSKIGYILGIYRGCSTLFLIGCCPTFVRHFGARRSYSISILCCVVIFMIFPIANILAQAGNTFGVWGCIALFGLMTACLKMGVGSSIYYFLSMLSRTKFLPLFSLHLYIYCRRSAQSGHGRRNQWSCCYGNDRCKYTISRSGDCAVVTVSRAQYSWGIFCLRSFSRSVTLCTVAGVGIAY